MNKELKKCPFCGGEADKCVQEINGTGYIFIVCSNCGATSQIFKVVNRGTKDENNPAIRAWNRRATDE